MNDCDIRALLLRTCRELEQVQWETARAVHEHRDAYVWVLIRAQGMLSREILRLQRELANRPFSLN